MVLIHYNFRTIRKFFLFILLISIAQVFIRFWLFTTSFNTSLHNKENFFVISVVFNPLSFKSRYELYKRFERYILSFGVRLITVELAFQNQTFKVTSNHNPNHVQLRTNDYLWYKENLINIAAKRLPDYCLYVAWIDADIVFTNPNWVFDTKIALQKYKVVQTFEYAFYLGPNSTVIRIDTGFGFSYANKRRFSSEEYKPLFAGNTNLRPEKVNGNEHLQKMLHSYWHPGFSWAIERSTLDNIGGLFELSILGANDRLMAFGFIGKIEDVLQKNASKSLNDHAIMWQKQVYEYCNNQLGYVKGNVLHYWHGSRKNRQFTTRDKILDSGPVPFDPSVHIYYDENNLIRFSGNNKSAFFSDSIHLYFENRKEDSDNLDE